MNLLDDDTADWEFYLGLLRAAVANHKLADGEVSSARAASARRAEIPRAVSRSPSRHQAARVPERTHRRTRAPRLASNHGHTAADRDRTRQPMISFLGRIRDVGLRARRMPAMEPRGGRTRRPLQRRQELAPQRAHGRQGTRAHQQDSGPHAMPQLLLRERYARAVRPARLRLREDEPRGRRENRVDDAGIHPRARQSRRHRYPDRLPPRPAAETNSISPRWPQSGESR